MTDETKPPALSLTLEWQGDLRFAGRCGEATMTLDSAGKAGPSPVQALAFALASCMAMDVAHILKKGRHAPARLSARLEAERSPADPRRLTAARLRFAVAGEVPAEAVARAIELSRQTYCSVWHSLRQDIDFHTSYEVVPGA